MLPFTTALFYYISRLAMAGKEEKCKVESLLFVPFQEIVLSLAEEQALCWCDLVTTF